MWSWSCAAQIEDSAPRVVYQEPVERPQVLLETRIVLEGRKESPKEQRRRMQERDGLFLEPLAKGL